MSIFLIILLIILYISFKKYKYKCNLEKLLNSKNFEEEFDIVIPWINWADENLKKFYKKINGPLSDEDVTGDFIELKYLLRSLEKLKINYNKIYIVHSDNHPPPIYLKKDHPQLNMIKHSEIVTDKSHLPLRARYPISINFHRIKGLKDFFFFIEDDTIITNKNYFKEQIYHFKNKKQPVWTMKPVKNKQEAGLWITANQNANEIVRKDHNKYKKDELIYYDTHGSWLLNKTIINEMEKKYKKSFILTSSTSHNYSFGFTNNNYVGIVALFNNYTVYNKGFEPIILEESFYNSIHTNNYKNPLSLQNKINLKTKLKSYKNYNYAVLQGPGISDEYDKHPEIHKIVYDWYEKTFPNKSKFEI